MTITLPPSFTDVERRDQGNGWEGNFGPGESLLWTRNHDTGVLTLDFSSPIMGFGSQFQRDSYVSFVAGIRAYDAGLNLLGSFTVTGNSTDAGDDSAIFIGVLSGLDDISRIQLDADSATHDFAINGPRIQMIPEPATIWLLLGGGLVLVARALRHRKL